MTISRETAFLALLVACSAEAGVMNPGQWEVTMSYLSASGPGANKALPKDPVVRRACLPQAFVDKENYTSPDFAMRRLIRMNFECTLDSRTGDARQAQWKYSCSRGDGFTVVNMTESTVAPDLFVQQGTETTKKNDVLWSEATVKVSGQYIGSTCQEGDTQVSP